MGEGALGTGEDVYFTLVRRALIAVRRFSGAQVELVLQELAT
jgi:hypothetical protein